MAATNSVNNQVVFYLDGQEFFAALLAGINAVVAAGVGTPNTYVRMAYWNAIHDMPLVNGLADLTPVGAPAPPAITVGDMLETQLRRVAARGFPAEVILYSPSRAERSAEAMAAAIYDDHLKFSNWLNDWTLDGSGSADPAGHPAGGKIRVYLEEYRAWSLFGLAASNHQKITICSVNGQRTVFLGGFNLARGYWDDAAHSRIADPWHDTGIAIRGPATDAVETEWLRRWRKSTKPIAVNATVQNAYAGGAAPAGGANAVAITLATTLTEGVTECDIQAQMVARIAAANNYIYLENYALSDPGLTAALVARINAPPAPIVLVNLSLPEGQYRWLDYVAWSQLAFLICNSVTVPNPAGGANLVVPRAGAPTWAVVPPSTSWTPGNFLQSAAIRWQQAGGPPPPAQTTNIQQIVAFTGGLRFYMPTRFYSPDPLNIAAAWQKIYLHSKLALFDDTWAVIGTSNWTARSMLYDGEMAAFCNSAALAAAIRARLFAHWNTDAGGVGDPAAQAFAAAPTAANWDAVAVENQVRQGLGALNQGDNYVVPLQMNYFAQQPPNDAAAYVTNYTWY